MYPKWRLGRSLIKEEKFLKANYPSDRAVDFLLPSLSIKAPLLKAKLPVHKPTGRLELHLEVSAGHWAKSKSNAALLDEQSSAPEACDFIPFYAGISDHAGSRKWEKHCVGLLVERADSTGGQVAYRRLGVGRIYYTTREGWDRKDYHRMVLQNPIREILLV